MEIEIGDWVLCPLTKDDVDDPRIVAKVVNVDDVIVTIEVLGGTVPMPRNYCTKVFVQILPQ